MSQRLTHYRNKYSGALYSFFRVADLDVAFRLFLKDPGRLRKFAYGEIMNGEYIARRLADLEADLDDAVEDDVRDFLNRRLDETRLLDIFWRAYEADEISDAALEDYRARQLALYGPLDPVIFGAILRYIESKAGTANDPLLAEIKNRLGEYDGQDPYVPATATFKHYQRAFKLGFAELETFFRTIDKDSYTHPKIISIFESALQAVGADKAGWRVESARHGTNVLVAKQRRKILVSRHFSPHNALRFRQIVAHEVGCHVLEALHNGKSSSEYEEGLAIVLEQLQAPKFSYKRSLRYLAVCLAFGVDGKRRDFSQVYEILWRVMKLFGHDEELARRRAFMETTRVFRGGLPSVAGMAFIKDKVYLETNLAIWRQLEKRLLTPEEFKELFTRHDTILLEA